MSRTTGVIFNGKPLVQAGSQFLPIDLCGMDGEVDELLNA
jgi:hypothetical protein